MLIHSELTNVAIYVNSPYHLMADTLNMYKGLEDLRLFEFEDKLWFICTSTHLTKNLINEIGIGYFNKDVTSVEYLQALDLNCRPIKNVTPFVYQNKIHLLDTVASIIYIMDVANDVSNFNATSIIKIVDTKRLSRGKGITTDTFKGSVSPVFLHGSLFGCVVHNNITSGVQSLSYLHYWMEFDIDLQMITFISTPFIVTHWGIEFISGIEKTEHDNSIYLYLGIDDKVPVKCATTLSSLRV
jgi:hypothetical protein